MRPCSRSVCRARSFTSVSSRSSRRRRAVMSGNSWVGGTTTFECSSAVSTGTPEHPGGRGGRGVSEQTTAVRWSPWRAVVGFGVVSLAADMVYEGARSITGPLLASLGASALLVGLVTGAGEAMALLMRLVFGSWADRSGRYWALTFAGYALTAVCVPALAITPFL